MGRYGVQPVREEVARRGYSVAQLADQLDVNYTHVKNSIYGISRPSVLLTDKLSELLGRPADELFTAEALQPGTPRGRRRPNYPRTRRTRDEIERNRTRA